MSNLITQRDFWRDPVQVFSGLAFAIIGGVIGFFIARVAA